MFKHCCFVVCCIKCDHLFHFSPFHISAVFQYIYFYLLSMYVWTLYTEHYLAYLVGIKFGWALVFDSQDESIKTELCLFMRSVFQLEGYSVKWNVTSNNNINKKHKKHENGEQMLVIYVNWLLVTKGYGVINIYLSCFSFWVVSILSGATKIIDGCVCLCTLVYVCFFFYSCCV